MTKEKLPDKYILNLPAAPDFISRPPKFTATEMIRLCEKMLPYWNQQRLKNPPPPFQGEPFVLRDDLPSQTHKSDKSPYPQDDSRREIKPE